MKNQKRWPAIHYGCSGISMGIIITLILLMAIPKDYYFICGFLAMSCVIIAGSAKTLEEKLKKEEAEIEEIEKEE